MDHTTTCAYVKDSLLFYYHPTTLQFPSALQSTALLLWWPLTSVLDGQIISEVKCSLSKCFAMSLLNLWRFQLHIYTTLKLPDSKHSSLYHYITHRTHISIRAAQQRDYVVCVCSVCKNSISATQCKVKQHDSCITGRSCIMHQSCRLFETGNCHSWLDPALNHITLCPTQLRPKPICTLTCLFSS